MIALEMNKLLADYAAFIEVCLKNDELSGRLKVLALDLNKRMTDFSERSQKSERAIQNYLLGPYNDED